MLGCLDDQEKKEVQIRHRRNVYKHRFESIRTISEPSTFETTHKFFQFTNLKMKFEKSEHKVKHRSNNELIKPMLYDSGMKHLNLV